MQMLLRFLQTVEHFFSVQRFVQTVEQYKKIFLLQFVQTVEQKKNFYCSTVCTNRRRENLNYLRFLQTIEQFDSEKKLDHRRPPPLIHHNYLYNLKLNLQ